MAKPLDLAPIEERRLSRHLAIEDRLALLAEVKRLRAYADALEANRSAEVWQKGDFVHDFREWAGG